jgi:hypothetical protein
MEKKMCCFFIILNIGYFLIATCESRSELELYQIVFSESDYGRATLWWSWSARVGFAELELCQIGSITTGLLYRI